MRKAMKCISACVLVVILAVSIIVHAQPSEEYEKIEVALGGAGNNTVEED